MKPLALTDQQLQMVIEAAARIPRWQRDLLLKKIASELEGKTVGDGSVHQAVRCALRAAESDHWRTRNPVLDGTGDVPDKTERWSRGCVRSVLRRRLGPRFITHYLSRSRARNQNERQISFPSDEKWPESLRDILAQKQVS